MIISQRNNIPVSAVEINDFSTALLDYKEFSDDNDASASDFINFLKTASLDRHVFLNRYDIDFVVESNMYAIQRIK